MHLSMLFLPWRCLSLMKAFPKAMAWQILQNVVNWTDYAYNKGKRIMITYL
jgi:hypothetical protein